MSTKNNPILAVLILLCLAQATTADCQTTPLYSYSGTGTNDNTIVNLTTMSEYVDANLTRVNVTTGQDYWMNSTYHLLINTPAGSEAYTVVIYDSFFNESKTVSETEADATINIPAANFTRLANVYKMTLKYENNTDYVFGEDITLEMLCDSYTPYTVDYLTLNLSTIVIGSREDALFRFTTPKAIREQNIVDNEKTFNFYLPQTTTDLLSIDYTLQDWVGEYGDSIVHFQKAYSDIWDDVDSRQWDGSGNINNVRLYKDDYYRITITTGTSTNDKGLFKYTDNGSQDIKLTEPIISYPTSGLEGLTHLTWQNKTTQRLYCYYLVEDAYTFTSSTFNIYNASATPQELIYSVTNTTTKESTFSYLAPNINYTYTVECIVDYQLGHKVRIGKYNFLNGTRFMMPTFDREILGYSIIELFTGFTVFICALILGLASGVNASLFLFLAAGMLWIFDYWSWIEYDSIIISFLLVFSVVFMFKSKRRGIG